ncbi:hypothetical protein G6F22_020297 [Rhizopus arrhizus]|nr:hypothetical protein G6F22_020297 [Rhizopus arrhizus]
MPSSSRSLAREAFDAAHQRLRDPVGRNRRPEQPRLLLGADIVGDHRHQFVLQRVSRGHLEEADAGQGGSFLQDGKQAADATADSVRQLRAVQVSGQTRQADGLPQALREHADQFVVGRLLA